MLLHGGWGHSLYPFDLQVETLCDRYHLYAPDRSGYGGSGQIASLSTNFHRQAATETFAVLDALGLSNVALWGHSDGAVIAAWMAIERPQRIDRLVLEAFHFDPRKPGSRDFFASLAAGSTTVDGRVAGLLAAEHGDPYWRTLVQLHAQAWLGIADERPQADADLYDGRLGDISAPVLLLHGRQDPRTEPGEIDDVRHALPAAHVAILESGAHSPHSERSVAHEATRLAAAFLDRPAG